MDRRTLTQRVKSLARAQGFERCGIARAEPIGRASYFEKWLDSGRAGTMDYLHRYQSKRLDPRQFLPGAKSVIVVALVYRQPKPSPSIQGEARGRVAMYAWGRDYHKVVKKKLFAMVDQLREEFGSVFDARVCVDTAPMIEREWASRAGVGWIGKNTLALNERLGSYFFLGEVVTSLDLIEDEPATDHCGTCTACLSACPTDAFPAPYEMDASRCISYLTIEHRSEIDRSLESKMDDWLFGCDVCQDVCPHNHQSPDTSDEELTARDRVVQPPLEEVLRWTEDDYRRNLRGSAMKRAKLGMLKRNARIAINNIKAMGGGEKKTD